METDERIDQLETQVKALMMLDRFNDLRIKKMMETIKALSEVIK